MNLPSANEMSPDSCDSNGRRPSVPRKPSFMKQVGNGHNNSLETRVNPPPLPRRPSNILNEVSNIAISEINNDSDTQTILTPQPIQYTQTERQGPTIESYLNLNRGTSRYRDICAVGEWVITLNSSNSVMTQWSISSGSAGWSITNGLESVLSFVPISIDQIVAAQSTGSLIVIDVHLGRILKKITSVSSSPIRQLKVFENTLFAIDDEGWIHLWNLDKQSSVFPEEKKGCFKVMERSSIICITSQQIWAGSGTFFEIQNRDSMNQTSVLARFDLINDLGLDPLVGSVIGIFEDGDLVFSVHEDGSIIKWSTRPLKPLQLYRIPNGTNNHLTATLKVDQFLWIGMANGKIGIVNLVNFEMLAEWRAHQAAINFLSTFSTFNSSSLSSSCWNPLISACDGGNLCAWDGSCWDIKVKMELLSEENKMKEYCTFKGQKVRICSWNVDSQRPPEDESFWLDWLGLRQSSERADIFVIALQEIVDLESKSTTARLMLQSSGATLNNKTTTSIIANKDDEKAQLWIEKALQVLRGVIPDIKCFKRESMVGLLLGVFAPSALSDRLRHFSSTMVKTGLGGLHGNKGSIICRFLLDDTSICLLNCHLAAGHSQTLARNADASQILKNATLQHFAGRSGVFLANNGEKIMDHEVCVLMGDLNYRINLGRTETEQLCQIGAFEVLFNEHDQLNQQKNEIFAHPLSSFHEEIPNYPPTYKYDRGTSKFDSSEKQRIPSYCDRILLRAPTKATACRINSLTSISSMNISDHRPIACNVLLKVKKIDPDKQHLMELKIRQDLLTTGKKPNILKR